MPSSRSRRATEDEGEQGAKFQPWTRDEEHTLTRIIKAHRDLPKMARYEAIHRDFYKASPKSARTWEAVRNRIAFVKKTPEQRKAKKASTDRSRAKRRQEVVGYSRLS